MKTAAIPDTVNIRGKIFPGEYKKRKMKSKDLYCWFNQETPHFPHASIEISHTHENWTDFHVTFPLTKEKGGWQEGVETVSYSVYVRIDPETDQITVTHTTDASRWKPSGENPGFVSFADSERRGLQFAKEFYSAAFLGT